jgi:hypothetical protein
MGSGSHRGGSDGLLAWDEAACAGCGVSGGGCRGDGANRATGGGGVSGIVVVVGAGEIGDGSARGVDAIRGSDSPEGAEGTRGGGGGLGAAVAEDRSRFVVMATDMIIGGGVSGVVCVMVMRTVGIDAGTRVICGRVGIGGAAAGVGGICAGGGPPCRSRFFCSSLAIRILIRAMLCCVSSGLSMRSLWCRCSWNSGDFSPNVRRMHSRNCNSVLALAASR